MILLFHAWGHFGFSTLKKIEDNTRGSTRREVVEEAYSIDAPQTRTTPLNKKKSGII